MAVYENVNNINITDVSQLVLTKQFSRDVLVLRNIGTEIIYINYSTDATVNSIPLAVGESIIYTDDAVPENDIYAICGAGLTSVLQIERGL